MLDFIKIATLCSAKDSVKRMRTNHGIGDDNLPKMCLMKDLYPKETILKLSNKKANI